MITTGHLLIDVLTNLPPARLLPWTPLTEPGYTSPPNEHDLPDVEVRRTPQCRIEQQSTWFPPSTDELNYIRYGSHTR